MGDRAWPVAGSATSPTSPTSKADWMMVDGRGAAGGEVPHVAVLAPGGGLENPLHCARSLTLTRYGTPEVIHAGAGAPLRWWSKKSK